MTLAVLYQEQSTSWRDMASTNTYSGVASSSRVNNSSNSEGFQHHKTVKSTPQLARVRKKQIDANSKAKPEEIAVQITSKNFS